MGRAARVLLVSLLAATFGAHAGCRANDEAPGSSPRPDALSVAAASDLRDALGEIVDLFQKDHPGTGVMVAYGSSGSFVAQIANGAPFDLFLSADVAYPRELASRGLTLPGSEFVYGEGHLALWVRSSSTLAIETDGLEALTGDAVTRVAIANPEHAPYGRAAHAALERAGVLDQVRPKLVLGDSVSQAMQFVQSGSADAGIVALSLALGRAAASAGRHVVIPASAHPPLEQGGIILRAAAQPDAARTFRAYMLADEARSVLERYGFTLPPRSTTREHPAGPILDFRWPQAEA